MMKKMISMDFLMTDQTLTLVKIKSKSESEYKTDTSLCFVEWKNSFKSAKLETFTCRVGSLS